MRDTFVLRNTWEGEAYKDHFLSNLATRIQEVSQLRGQHDQILKLLSEEELKAMQAKGLGFNSLCVRVNMEPPELVGLSKWAKLGMPGGLTVRDSEIYGFWALKKLVGPVCRVPFL